ncbi:MAG: 3-deoxy-D-manno-octulosonic acid transferase, partial [Planctomycetaceae bacterium]|nr:3-deoxy-D-manno-octulosonic acid transferase [Planctomycetaceae bacterium]
SVGEILQLQSSLRTLSQRRPEHQFVISTTTGTGYAVARERFPEHTVCYFPLDFTWAVKNAIARIRPDVVVLVEMELWPNFTRAVHEAGIPLALINGRLGERSFRGYRRIRPLVRPMLERFSLLAVQTDDYARRLIALGAPAESVHVTGSVKYDGVESDRRNPRTEALRRLFAIGPEETVFIAGSTLDSEETLAVRAWLRVRESFPDVRLIVVPRHQERFDDVARLLSTRFELNVVRKSRLAEPLAPDAAADRPVILLDTLGELSACWGLADVAFVGGSTVPPRGGQSMIEPAAYGSALLFGPDTANFEDLTDQLLAENAVAVVHNERELGTAITQLLTDAQKLHARGQAARRIVLARGGAIERTVERLLTLHEDSAANEQAEIARLRAA